MTDGISLQPLGTVSILKRQATVGKNEGTNHDVNCGNFARVIASIEIIPRHMGALLWPRYLIVSRP
jgi:hypothetical protein